LSAGRADGTSRGQKRLLPVMIRRSRPIPAWPQPFTTILPVMWGWSEQK
jgi:hypothetical protein